MKKQFISIAIVGMGLVFLVSCTKEQKENVVAPVQKVDVARVVFESIEEYENLFADPATSEEKINKVAARFGTFNESARVGTALEDTLYPEELQKILNDDHIVQIAQWLIKVDAAKEQVLVLDKKYLDQYNDLAISNLNNKNILVYSTEDEVLSMLQNGESPSNARVEALFCSESGGRAKQNDGPAIANINLLNTQGGVTLLETRYNIETRYLKLGIYFELKCKAQNDWWQGVALNAAGKYNIACVDNGDLYFNEWKSSPADTFLGEAILKPYTGIKKLNKYFLTATVASSSKDYFTNQYIFASPTRTITDGY